MFKKCVVGMLVIGLIFSLGIASFAEKTKLLVYERLDGCLEDTTEKLEIAFEEEFPDIDITIETFVPKTYQNEILLLAASGKLDADVIYSVSDFRLNVFVNGGIIIPLDELLEKSGIDISKYPQRLFQAGTRNGKLYGFPQRPQPRGTVNYNQDLFDELGIPYITRETTWEEFKGYLRKLTLKDEDGTVIRYGCLDKYPQLDLLYLFGGRMVDDPFNPTEVVFGEDLVKVFGEFLEMAEEGLMMPLPVYKALGGSKPKIFAEEKVATIITHLGYRGGFATASFRWDAELIPAPNGVFGGAHTDLMGWSINAKSKNPEVAFKWIKWSTFSPIAQNIYDSQWEVNSNKMSYVTELNETFAEIADQRQPAGWRCVYEAQKNVVVFPIFEGSGDFMNKYWEATWGVLYDGNSLETLLEAEKEMQRLLDEALAK